MFGDLLALIANIFGIMYTPLLRIVDVLMGLPSCDLQYTKCIPQLRTYKVYMHAPSN